MQLIAIAEALLVFLFVFAGFWCLVSLKISRLGWSGWAQTYRCNHELKGKSYSQEYGRLHIPPVSHTKIVNILLSDEGIGLSVLYPWRILYPSLLVPWSKVVGMEETKVFFTPVLRITLSDAGRTFSFELPLSAKQEIETRKLDF